MGLDITFGSVLTYAAGLLVLVLFGKLLAKPLKWIFKLVLNGIIGGILLVIFNLTIGAIFDFIITINPLTALVAGILGVPGVILLIFVKLIF